MTTTTVADKPLENNALKADSSHKEEKQSPAAQAKTADPAPPVSPETQNLSDQAKKLNEITENNSKSWGDRFKEVTFGTVKHGVVNYAINTVIAATFSYAFERVAEKHWKKMIASVIGKGKLANDPVELHKLQDTGLYKGVNYGFSAVLLTAGGTLLLPVMKHMEENRQYYEYQISKVLDKTQTWFGSNNSDTESNLNDYKLIAKISADRHAGKPCESTEKEMTRLEEKYHFAFQENGDLKFDKVNIPWMEMVKARGMAILMSMTAGFVLGSSKKWGATAAEKAPVPNTAAELHAMEAAQIVKEEAGDFGKRGFGKLESLTIKPMADGFKKLPVIGKYFGTSAEVKAGSKVMDSVHYAKLLFMDAILTVVSAVTFAVATGKKKENEPDKKVLDTNKDGWVTLEEKQAYKEAHKEADVSGVRVDNVIQSGHHAAKVGKAPKPDIYKHAQPKNGGGFGEQITSERQTAQDVPAHAIH